jgi:hypothetical protein
MDKDVPHHDGSEQHVTPPSGVNIDGIQFAACALYL